MAIESHWWTGLKPFLSFAPRLVRHECITMTLKTFAAAKRGRKERERERERERCVCVCVCVCKATALD